MKYTLSKTGVIYNLQFSYVYLMSYYNIPWFYKDFNNENLFFKSVLSSRCKNIEPVTRDHVKSCQMCNEKPFQL